MTRYLSTLALALAAAFMTPHADAEKVIVYREGQLVDPQDVAAVLGKNRSIRLLDEAPSASAPASASASASAPATPTPTKYVSAAAVALAKTSARSRESVPADASALSLPVRFAFDSTDILPAARAQLDALADGIKLLAPNSVVMVEGHTDAVGSDAYNLELSRGRARAVRDYLVQHHGIEAARLKTVGYGESRPIDHTDPNAGVNRRVQFHGA